MWRYGPRNQPLSVPLYKVIAWRRVRISVLNICHCALVIRNHKTAGLYGLTRPVQSAIKGTPIRGVMLVRQILRRVNEATVLFTVTSLQSMGRGRRCGSSTAMLVDLCHKVLQPGIQNSRYGVTVDEIYFVFKITPSEDLINWNHNSQFEYRSKLQFTKNRKHRVHMRWTEQS